MRILHREGGRPHVALCGDNFTNASTITDPDFVTCEACKAICNCNDRDCEHMRHARRTVRATCAECHERPVAHDGCTVCGLCLHAALVNAQRDLAHAEERGARLGIEAAQRMALAGVAFARGRFPHGVAALESLVIGLRALSPASLVAENPRGKKEG